MFSRNIDSCCLARGHGDARLDRIGLYCAIGLLAIIQRERPGYFSPALGYCQSAYTLAFTCQASLDNRALADAAVTFSPIMTGIVVTADNTTTVNIS